MERLRKVRPSGWVNMAGGRISVPSEEPTLSGGNRVIKGGLGWMRLDRAKFPTEIRVATLLREDPVLEAAPSKPSLSANIEESNRRNSGE